MSQRQQHSKARGNTKAHAPFPWEGSPQSTAREQVVRILAEGIWEMVLAGNAPQRPRESSPEHSACLKGEQKQSENPVAITSEESIHVSESGAQGRVSPHPRRR